MSNFLIGLLGALVATNQPAAVSNLVVQTTGISISIPDANDPVDKELDKLGEESEAARAEVDKWITENNAFAERGAGVPPDVLNTRIRARLETIKKAYLDFLQRHPNHVYGHIDFGNFLNDTEDEEGAVAQYEKARELDPKNPTPWNQLANYYAHRGPVQKAFGYYEKAIELAPAEPIYYQNLADIVYLYRKDARENYKIEEQQVFDKALELYAQAMKLAPDDFKLAQDVAQSYYGIRPLRLEAALNAWTNALKIAGTDLEKEGVYIHLARLKLSAERFDEARQHLSHVTNSFYDDLKNRVLRNLNNQEAQAKASNNPPAGAGVK
jgi:tetratricopeptide (TPR) repeat protein